MDCHVSLAVYWTENRMHIRQRTDPLTTRKKTLGGLATFRRKKYFTRFYVKCPLFLGLVVWAAAFDTRRHLTSVAIWFSIIFPVTAARPAHRTVFPARVPPQWYRSKPDCALQQALLHSDLIAIVKSNSKIGYRRFAISYYIFWVPNPKSEITNDNYSICVHMTCRRRVHYPGQRTAVDRYGKSITPPGCYCPALYVGKIEVSFHSYCDFPIFSTTRMRSKNIQIPGHLRNEQHYNFIVMLFLLALFRTRLNGSPGTDA
ncbi:Hypothetical protein CINCED_3A020246 [Cinara cedri]|uniref:Uncharacterized protein n=1 Tax=Cinara cedri TaxID=506608 RepID=A0A5E4MUR0_9HEMI|nr:Hypothetical protein CINCED_3A020246 [Cinara cedri]